MRKLIQCVRNENIKVTPQETIYAIKKAGFDGVFVQFKNKDGWEITLQQQIDLCRELGFCIEFAHLCCDRINEIWVDKEIGDDLIEAYKHDLDLVKKNNIPMVIMHLTDESVAPPPSEVGIRRLQVITDYAEELGIKIAFENFRVFGYLEYVFDHIKNKNIGICYDSGHCHCYFNDKFNWDKFKNKIFALHLHNNDQSKDLHLLPFDKKGTINWQRLIRNLKDAGFDGPITLESCYSCHYLEQTLEDFYKESYEQAVELRKMF